MAGVRVAVVTGGNKGIGYAIVEGLCEKFNGTVYLTARNETLGKEAVAKLNQKGYKPLFHQLDIDDEKSIQVFSKFIQDTHGGIDVLVNNAAIAYKQAATEPFSQQAQHTVRVNYFATLNVCHALLPLIRSHGRVVNVSSVCGHLSRINGKEPAATELRNKFSSPNLTEQELSELMKQFIQAAQNGDHFEKGWPNSTYNVSKVGVSALTILQQKAFDSDDSRTDIIVNSVHPGYVDTDMSSHKGPLTIYEGASAPLYLALLSPDVKEPKGQYIWRDSTVVDWVNGPLPGPY